MRKEQEPTQVAFSRECAYHCFFAMAELQCVICYGTPLPPLMRCAQCSVWLCGTCQSKLKPVQDMPHAVCPQCRLYLAPKPGLVHDTTREMALLADTTTLFACPHAPACTAQFTYAALATHVPGCKLEPVSAPVPTQHQEVVVDTTGFATALLNALDGQRRRPEPLRRIAAPPTADELRHRVAPTWWRPQGLDGAGAYSIVSMDACKHGLWRYLSALPREHWTWFTSSAVTCTRVTLARECTWTWYRARDAKMVAMCSIEQTIDGTCVPLHDLYSDLFTPTTFDITLVVARWTRRIEQCWNQQCPHCQQELAPYAYAQHIAQRQDRERELTIAASPPPPAGARLDPALDLRLGKLQRDAELLFQELRAAPLSPLATQQVDKALNALRIDAHMVRIHHAARANANYRVGGDHDIRLQGTHL